LGENDFTKAWKKDKKENSNFGEMCFWGNTCNFCLVREGLASDYFLRRVEWRMWVRPNLLERTGT